MEETQIVEASPPSQTQISPPSKTQIVEASPPSQTQISPPSQTQIVEASPPTQTQISPPSQTQIVEASPLSQSMQRELDELWGKPNERKNFTIFRAPHSIRESQKRLLEPSVISIGPFHHGQPRLQAMEEQKWQFLRDFLSHGDISLDDCISAMKPLEERTRRCYSETVDLDSDGFVKMMLLDGCFVLEYSLKCKEDGYYECGWTFGFVICDLLLLENQIPFFVVEKLWEIGLKQEDRINFVNNLIRNIWPRGPVGHPLLLNPPDEIHHLVHLYYHCSVPDPGEPDVSSPKRIKELLLGFLSWVLKRRFPGSTSQNSFVASPNSTENISWMVIPCATELQDAGVKLRPKSDPQHMLDISFVHGVLEIPKLVIEDKTKPLFINLIAFEQCQCYRMDDHLSSFAVLLDSLINTEKDVIILQQCGIVENCLSGEEEFTQFINQISQDTVLEDDHFLANLFTEVNRYCQSSWNKYRAKLIRDYFSNPWAIISLIAALVLLILTCVQSFFAVYGYFVPPS